MATKYTPAHLQKVIDDLSRHYMPSEIMTACTKTWCRYLKHVKQHSPWFDFWHKCCMASSNLASGMKKWTEEALDEE